MDDTAGMDGILARLGQHADCRSSGLEMVGDVDEHWAGGITGGVRIPLVYGVF